MIDRVCLQVTVTKDYLSRTIELAQRIKEIAREHDVPIFENPPLARALYESVDIGEMIPEELYFAVAQILAQVYRMRGVAV